ncbi:MAG: asparagine synthetase B, partial [Crocinitomicaceae bacterium]|nr:asparagine synthetase B [Crocinitomicaceae bacterium]
MTRLFSLILFTFLLFEGKSTQILIQMDDSQKNHLKAYGIAYWAIDNEITIEWLLNYRGGSFLLPHLKSIEEEIIIRGISYEIKTDGQISQM